jgi:AraC-like DNA-binding protein/ligand-binding sensor protein
MREEEIRSIEPLLTKTRQLLTHYDKATELNSAVLDRSGNLIKITDFEKQLRFCELCRKYFHNPSRIWRGDEYPCDKIHQDALAESRQTGKTHIYACKVGFAYWSSPIYHKGRYTGALTAGQVLTCSRNEAAEKFHSLCKDKIAAEKFHQMLEGTQEKSHEEIQAMARLLGVCAEEISEKEKYLNFTFRKIAMNKAVSTACESSGETGGLTQKEGESGYPQEKERLLLAAFRRGDSETGAKILRELIDSTVMAIPGNTEILRVRAIQLLVLLSRAASEDPSDATMPDANTYATYTLYLKRIQESKTTEKLIENLYLIAGHMAARIFSFKGIRHASVLRRAERYIWENYTRKISLKEAAKAAGLSSPYFSSVFKKEMGENFSAYLNRLRVERAMTMLTGTTKPLNEIAKLCGFEDQSWFSKTFKRMTGASPGKYRETI